MPDQTGDTAVLTDELFSCCRRYALYKVGPVICASHGIGQPSMSVVLHELVKLARYARMQDPVFIRLGE